jgi:hypothetical protein
VSQSGSNDSNARRLPEGDPAQASGRGAADPSAPTGVVAPPALGPGAVARPAQACAWQILQGEAVLLDLAGRKVMGLNAVGSFAWGLLDGSRTLAQLAEAVAGQFEIGVDQAASDLATFLAALQARGLVEVTS